MNATAPGWSRTPTRIAVLALMAVGVVAEGPDGSHRIFVTAEGDSDSHINVRSTEHDQFERDIENRVASFIVNEEQTEVAIQPCARGNFYGSFCGPFSTFYPYQSAPPVEEPPAGQTRPDSDGDGTVDGREVSKGTDPRA